MANLEVPCFVYHGEECRANLAIEEAAGELLVQCPLRQRLYSLTPEERVRQALIWFLVEGAGSARSWNDRLHFAAEQRSVDVSGFLRPEATNLRFAPKIPVLAVETKREEHDCLSDANVEQQLVTYMRRERCRDGLLFNSRVAGWVSNDGDFAHGHWATCQLTDLSEVEDRIQKATAGAIDYQNSCREAFTAASRGDFDSFIRLVRLFGTDSGLTFIVSMRRRGTVSSEPTFCLRALSENLIAYRSRGVVSRNAQQLSRQDYHSLISIRPI